MIKLFVKRFIQNYNDTTSNVVREKYGILGGILGIICNVFLFLLKLAIGLITGSIAIVSDSVNNLSDCGTSVVAVVSAKLSNRKPDDEHPFGHGRIEYISSLIVSFVTILLGFELAKSSFVKILHSEPTEFTLVTVLILFASVFVKVWMYSYNTYLAKAINSSVLNANAKDSISDAISTGIIVIASVVAGYFKIYWLDGVIGILVSLLVMKTGYDVASDTVGVLLGKSPDPEVVQKIRDTVLSGDQIINTHDLIIHDYGPGRMMASVHAEVPDDVNVVYIHKIIDELEMKISTELGIHMVIHMDPVAVNDEKTQKIKAQLEKVLIEYDEKIGMHDFRIVDNDTQINLLFDLEVPVNMMSESRPIADDISHLMHEVDERYHCIIHIDMKI